MKVCFGEFMENWIKVSFIRQDHNAHNRKNRSKVFFEIADQNFVYTRVVTIPKIY